VPVPEARRCQQWVERVLTDAAADSVERANALKIDGPAQTSRASDLAAPGNPADVPR